MPSTASKRRWRWCARCSDAAAVRTRHRPGGPAGGHNRPMNWQKILFPILAGVVLVGAWQGYGWGGVALAGGAIVMYLLLHFNRLMHVIKKASDRPKGYVGSAVMLNAKLKPG